MSLQVIKIVPISTSFPQVNNHVPILCNFGDTEISQ